MYELLDDKELMERMDKAVLADRLLNDPIFKLIDEVRKRAIERWTDYFALKIDPKNITDVAMVKAILQIWKYDFFKVLDIMKQDGEAVFEELKYRNKIRQPDTKEGNGQEP